MIIDYSSIEIQPKPTYPQFRDLDGQIFGRLTILGYAGNKGRAFWYARCECGQFTKLRQDAITTGNTRSCGCYGNDHRPHPHKHGYTNTRVHRIWIHMRERCRNPNARSFANYGERGIIVCERWQIFENFLADMGEPPDGMSIERINNDDNYYAENCKWATPTEQADNRTTTIRISLNGRTQTLTQWCKELHMNRSTVYSRLTKNWHPELALTTPPKTS